MAMYSDLVFAALKKLYSAVKELTKDTTPITPMPRPRVFFLAEGITWPLVRNQKIMWTDTRVTKRASLGADPLHASLMFVATADFVLDACGHQPRLIHRALRRIQAATAWCEARTEGRRRQAAEILRQQARAVYALDAEVALEVLQR